ncbi:hypothetical protein GCM10010528_26430 [Gordonia defluvii]|uniref:Mycothiol-dependent maleylpyruvate isomerase metal-binding domain-containing protein n=1 Tax=Gordonia defluvii TaxID=283718 RepID=A0ABP6LIJ9_9ACTN
MTLSDTTATALDDAAALWIAALNNVGPQTYSQPSGCGAWTIAELINHVAGGGERYAMLDSAPWRGGIRICWLESRAINESC